MPTIKRFVYCPCCGRVELTKAQYDYQMCRVNHTWRCPNCRSEAAWGGEYYPCVDPTCSGYAQSDGNDQCDTCGRDQYTLYSMLMEGEL